MRWLWEYTQRNVEKEEKQQNAFLFLNTVVWTVGAFLAALILGILFMPAGWSLLGGALLVAGYSGVFIGFLGGGIFLMRNTSE